MPKLHLPLVVACLLTAAGTLAGVGGAAAGSPSLVVDIRDGQASSEPQQLVTLPSGLVLFSADDGSHGRELWRSTGSGASTQMVEDINPNGDSGPQAFIPPIVNGVYVFGANDGVHGGELWRSDGSAVGTWMIKDINPGTFGSLDRPANAPNGAERRATAAPLASDPTIGNVMLFSANDGDHGSELWRTDFTEAGTWMVKDIRTGSDSSNASYFTNVNGIVYFGANDGTHGEELWRTNGTEAGTWMVKNINQDSSSGNSGPDWLTNVNGTLYFAARDGPLSGDRGLWRSDGTEAGTVVVRKGQSSSWLTNLNGTLVFAGAEGSNAELWKSDGTLAGTQIVTEINPQPGAGSGPFWLTKAGPYVYFTASEPTHGEELWRTDGTAAGTILVRDITPGTGGTFIYGGYMAEVQQRLVFQAGDTDHGREPWETTGSDAGTHMIGDINPGAAESYASYFASSDDTLLFAAYKFAHGFELWGAPSGGAPTAVVVRSFEARRVRGGRTSLRWQLGSRQNVLGFRVYRQEDGRRARLGAGLIAPARTSYSVETRGGGGAARYRLEVVRTRGASVWASATAR